MSPALRAETLVIAVPVLPASPLSPGSAIGIIAPSSPAWRYERLERGLRALEGAGYRPIWEPVTPRGYLAGTDAERLKIINGMLRRSDLHALMCVRGGYGALRILGGLDYAAARRHPKLLTAFSDGTALQLALLTKAGWRSLSGPLVVEWAEISERTRTCFLDLARGEVPASLAGPDKSELVPMRQGVATGPLVGGNLSTIVRMIGSAYLPPLSGAILFLEEVGEAPYRIDALFAQLRLAGILDRIGGLVLGAFTDWEPRHDRPVLSPSEIWADYLGEAPYPVATNLAYGHFPNRATMPVGVQARLTVTETDARLSIIEPVAQ